MLDILQVMGVLILLDCHVLQALKGVCWELAECLTGHGCMGEATALGVMFHTQSGIGNQ